MKTFLILLIICFCISSCNKDVVITSGTDSYVYKVKSALRDSISTAVFTKLDFHRAIISGADSADLHFIAVPFKNTAGKDFALIQTDKSGSLMQGRLISLSRKNDNGFMDLPLYNGNIIIRSFKDEVLINSDIVNGHIVSFPPKNRNNTQMLYVQPALPIGEPLPDVVVVGHYGDGGGLSYSEWLNLASMFYGGSGMGGNYYTPSGASTGFNNNNSYYNDNGNTGVYHGGGGGSNYQVPLIQIGFETQIANPAIDIESYLKCFSTIPDEGAVCSIEILADIPVDNDPSKLFNWEVESPGHTFLQIKKSNGNQTIMQNIGFYPKENWKTMLTPAPVSGKLVDNSGHEFNAALRINLTPAQLKLALTHILYVSKFVKYDIDEYNCTDFALDVFNSIRRPDNQLIIPKYDIPGGMAPNGTNTPQGLYNKLKSIKQSGNGEASNILLPGYKGWVANSNGPCN